MNFLLTLTWCFLGVSYVLTFSPLDLSAESYIVTKAVEIAVKHRNSMTDNPMYMACQSILSVRKLSVTSEDINYEVTFNIAMTDCTKLDPHYSCRILLGAESEKCTYVFNQKMLKDTPKITNWQCGGQN